MFIDTYSVKTGTSTAVQCNFAQTALNEFVAFAVDGSEIKLTDSIEVTKAGVRRVLVKAESIATLKKGDGSTSVKPITAHLVIQGDKALFSSENTERVAAERVVCDLASIIISILAYRGNLAASPEVTAPIIKGIRGILPLANSEQIGSV